MRVPFAFFLSALLLSCALPGAWAAKCQASMESKINGRSGGEKHRDSLRAGETLTLSTEGVLSMTGLFMTTDSGWLGSSSFKVAIYVSGNLDRQYSDAVSCFEMSPRPLGDCPSGGDGAITLTCNNWWGDCPLYYWVNVEATDTCAPPSPEPESSPSLPASPPELPPPSNATCDAASLMQDTELFGGALSLDGVPAVQPVDGWEECCATCAELPECKAWSFLPSSSVCGGPCCMLKGEGYSPMPSKGAVSGA